MTHVGSGAPTRPDAPVGVARPGRRWFPTVLVALVLSVTVFGGFVVAGTLSAPEVAPLTVGGVATINPLPGWEVVRREPAVLPSPTGGTIEGSFAQLSRGSGALDILALPAFEGAPDELSAFYVEEVLSHQLERLSVSSELESVGLRSGLDALRFGYIGTESRSGAAIEGSVTIVVAPSGDGVVFDGWGFEGQLELIDEELDTMIETAEVA